VPDRWVPTPDATGPDDAWEAFTASLDPVTIESERYRAPGINERPWSRGDLEVRHAHAWVAADYWRRVADTAETRRRRAHDAEVFVSQVMAARRNGTPYPTVPISVTLDVHRAQSSAGGIAA